MGEQHCSCAAPESQGLFVYRGRWSPTRSLRHAPGSPLGARFRWQQSPPGVLDHGRSHPCLRQCLCKTLPLAEGQSTLMPPDASCRACCHFGSQGPRGKHPSQISHCALRVLESQCGASVLTQGHQLCCAKADSHTRTLSSVRQALSCVIVAGSSWKHRLWVLWADDMAMDLSGVRARLTAHMLVQLDQTPSNYSIRSATASECSAVRSPSMQQRSH